ncbi:MAG: hypothetical protein ABH812_01490 [bacterium]
MKQYNLYNLEASFLQFLNSGNKKLTNNTIKNYLSDLRHFFGWFIFKLQANRIHAKLAQELHIPTIITEYFDKIVVLQYKAYQIQNNIPLQTANRRLSTLRKLSSFFISQQWISLNPTDQLRNIVSNKGSLKNKYYISKESDSLILNEYKRALQSHNLNLNAIKEELKNINELLNFK